MPRLTYVVSDTASEYDIPYETLGIVSHNPNDLYNADLVAFNGGHDVSPDMYGEKPHPTTSASKKRDSFEQAVYNRALLLNIPMVGICRGAQFLNVMNGGKIIQNVTNHSIGGTHTINMSSGKEIGVTSTHHQMMWPKGYYELLGWSSGLSVVYETVDLDRNKFVEEFSDGGIVKEPDVVWWPKTKCLGVQYHPEYMDKKSDGYNLYLDLLKEYIL